MAKRSSLPCTWQCDATQFLGIVENLSGKRPAGNKNAEQMPVRTHTGGSREVRAGNGVSIEENLSLTRSRRGRKRYWHTTLKHFQKDLSV